MATKDWQVKSMLAGIYRRDAELWERGWVKGPKTKKGKKGYYNRLQKKYK